MTKTVGYLNPNNWPVVVNISAVNVNVMVESKKFVLDREGRKINDPLLENYVGPGMLVRESTKADVPLILFPRVEVPQPSSNPGFGASNKVDKNDRGIVQDSSYANAGQPSAPTHSASIKTYTVEEAFRLGVVKPLLPTNSAAPTADVHRVGDPIPDIDSETPREAKPGEVRRLVGKSAPKPAAAPTPAPQVELSEAELAAKSEALLKSLGADSMPSLEDLEDQEGEDEKPTVPETPKKGVFVCAADGREFPRKDRLIAHVRKHFPEREKELLAGVV
jgi:hypothetical protein